MEEKIDNAKSKTEQAALMGVKIPEDDYWGDYSSRICGSVGGAIGGDYKKDTIASFEHKLVKRK